MEKTFNDFVSINALKYADPIQWSIVNQYEKNTIVIDPLSGTAYISVQPVPTGISITNTDYWTVVFDLGSFVVRAAKNFTTHYEDATTLTATFPSTINDWLIWGDTLYRVTSDIVAGDQYVIGSNIVRFTAEDVIGHIQDLTTTDKSNLVAAINETVTNISDINTLIDYRKEFNVRDYGAVGNGVTDDTQAFTDTISAAHGNGYVYIPEGDYLITSTLNLTGGDILYSKGGTIIAAALAIEITGNYNIVSGLTIHTNNSSDGIYIHNAFITTIQDLNTYGLNIGINAGAKVYGVSVINSNIYNSIAAGIYYNNQGASGDSNGLSLLRVNMDSLDSAPQPTMGGIVCISGEGLYCVNCEIIRQKVGLLLNPVAGGGCKYYILSNCIFDLCTDHGIYINADAGDIFNIALTNCWSSTSGGEGVLIASDGGVIESVNLSGLSCNNNNIGVRVKQTSGNIKNINLNNSNLISNSAIGTGIHDAIIVEGYVSEVSIMNNIIDGAIAGYLNDNHYGINIGANVNNVEIMNNIISGCTSDPIYSSTTGYTVIERNLKAPMPESLYKAASDMKAGGSAVDTKVSGAASPSCINLLATQDCYGSFEFRVSKYAAIAGSAYLNLQFMAYGSDTGDINFKITVGQENLGANFTVNTMSKTVNGASPAIIYNVDCGQLPISLSPHDIIYITIEREGTDTFTHDIALLGAVINYFSI